MISVNTSINRTVFTYQYIECTLKDLLSITIDAELPAIQDSART